MRTIWKDVRYGARALWKSPGFTLVAVLAVALGVGANTAIFSVVNTVLLRALPYENSERLVALYTGRGPDAPGGPLSYPDLLDYRAQAKSLEYVAGYQGVGTVLSQGQGDEPERVRGVEAMADLFPLLGVRPALGRVFTREEDEKDGPRVIVISDGFWRRRFGSDPNVVGREVGMGLARRPATVIGVMPPGFKFPPDEAEAIDYYEPFVASNLKADPDSMNNRGAVFIPTVAKLRDGATAEQALAEVETISNRIAAEYPDTSANRRARAVRLHEDLVGQVRPALLILLGAVGLVLLIACANVANLLLARAASRGREIAVRTALGATRARVARQLLTESLLLSLAGGAAGLLLSFWAVEAIVRLSPATVPRLAETTIDARVFLFALGVSILTGLVFGLAPALQASKTDLAEALKEGGRGGAGARRNRLRSALVVAEVALSLVLLVGAGLLIKSFRQLVTTDPGYSPERVLAVLVALNTQKFKDEESRAGYYREAVARISQLPGVESAGLTRLLPLGRSDIFNTFQIAGRPPFAPGESRAARSYTVSHDYFRTLGVPLRRGRVFTAADGKDAPGVIIINEAFVRQYFGGQEPLGRHVVLDGPDDKPLPPREVVGVVGDVRFQKLNDEARPEYYIPFEQAPSAVSQVVVRVRGGDAAALTASVRAALKGVDPNLLIWETRTMDGLVGQSVAPQRFNVALLGFFAGLAMLLAAVGIYGVMSYAVTQRRHEIGVRLALGAQARDVLRLVVGQGMQLTLLGLGLGLAGALALTRLMASLLYGVSATDPYIFAAVSLLLAAVALLACYVPARRATKVDPMEALRYE